MIANMFAAGSVVILILVVCSEIGIFEFGRVYTRILLCAGLVIALSPSFLIHFLPDNVTRYYMLGMAAVLIGFLGTNNHIGVYMTYALVPVVSCLYFEPKLVVRTGIFSYVIMLISVYLDSAHLYEVVDQGRPRMQMFVAYALGFTVEFLLVNAVLFFLVKRAKQMMEERYSAQEQNRMKSEFLSNMSHEIPDTVMEKSEIGGSAADDTTASTQDRPSRILVVDDNDINREVIKAMLESQNFIIEEARDGQEAVEVSKNTLYDLILMDSHMPVMSGEEATRIIRKEKTNQNQTTPLIAITADAIAGVREKLLESGMNDCLVKPIERQQLYKMIEKYL